MAFCFLHLINLYLNIILFLLQLIHLHIELNYPQELNNQISLVYWNIKESIYKAVGIKGIDFKKNILALPLDINSTKCKSWYVNNDDIYSFETYFRISKNYTLAFVIKN